MSDPNMENLLGLLGQVNALLEATPEGEAIFQRIRSGEITPDEGVVLLAEAAKDAGLLPDLEAASEQVSALVPSGDLTPEALDAAGRPIMMETSTGIPQLNPVYEAAIAERVTLDGDAPELRSGALPPEGHPAVPVVTTARDPVIIGLMLERASNEVQREIRLAIADHADICERLLEDARENALAEGRDVGTALALTKKKLPAAPVGITNYPAGGVPALREVTPPDPHVTAVMTPELRRVATYKTLSSTQGRRSAAPVIESALRTALVGRGFELNGLPPVEDHDRSQCFTWAAQVFGPDDLSDQFNPIQVAIDQLAAQCQRDVDLTHSPPGGWALQVFPYNQGISQRQFGWTVRIGAPQEES